MRIIHFLPFLFLSVLAQAQQRGSQVTMTPTSGYKTAPLASIKAVKPAVAPLPTPTTIREELKMQPLFGEQQKNALEIAEDTSFLTECGKSFASQTEASSFFTIRAWEYLAEGNTEMAIYRFNLAYLLNAQNVDVYWGLGVVEYQQNKLLRAIELLSKGVSLDSTNATLLVDLATVHLKSFIQDKDTQHITTAFSLLEKATKIAPEFADAYQKMCLVEMNRGKFDKAWWYFHKSYELNPETADPELLIELAKQQPDPMGIFKQN